MKTTRKELTLQYRSKKGVVPIEANIYVTQDENDCVRLDVDCAPGDGTQHVVRTYNAPMWDTAIRQGEREIKGWLPDATFVEKKRLQVWGERTLSGFVSLRVSAGDKHSVLWTVERTAKGHPTQVVYAMTTSWEAAIEAGRAAIKVITQAFPEMP